MRDRCGPERPRGRKELRGRRTRGRRLREERPRRRQLGVQRGDRTFERVRQHAHHQFEDVVVVRRFPDAGRLSGLSEPPPTPSVLRRVCASLRCRRTHPVPARRHARHARRRHRGVVGRMRGRAGRSARRDVRRADGRKRPPLEPEISGVSGNVRRPLLALARFQRHRRIVARQERARDRRRQFRLRRRRRIRPRRRPRRALDAQPAVVRAEVHLRRAVRRIRRAYAYR